jgi:hypothetical protein
LKLDQLLPILAAIIAVAAVFLRDHLPAVNAKKREAPAGAFLVLAIVVAVLVFGAFSGYGGLEDALPLTLSAAIGALLAAVAYGVGLMPGQQTAGRSAPMGMAVLAVGAIALLPYPSMPLALVFGAAVGAWFLSIGTQDDPNPWGMRAAAFVGPVVAVNLLGKAGQVSEYGSNAGTLLGLAIALAAVLAGVFGSLLKGTVIARLGAMVILTTVGVWLIGDRLLQVSELLVLGFGGSLLALIVHGLCPEEDDASTLRLTVGSVIWIAAGSAAFGYAKGFGVAVVLLVATGVLLAAGNRRALLTLGPLAALTFFRVFRETHTEAPRALDLAQHYAMIGLVLGATLPVMAQEWLRTVSKRGGFLTLVAGGLWIAVLIVGPVAAAVLLGAKGAVGYVFGLGMAALIEAVRGERSAHAYTLGMGLSAAMTATFGVLLPHLDLARDEKLVRLAWLGGGVLVLALAIAVLSGEFKRSKEQQGA